MAHLAILPSNTYSQTGKDILLSILIRIPHLQRVLSSLRRAEGQAAKSEIIYIHIKSIGNISNNNI